MLQVRRWLHRGAARTGTVQQPLQCCGILRLAVPRLSHQGQSEDEGQCQFSVPPSLGSGQHGSQLLPPLRPPGDGNRLECLRAFCFNGWIYFWGPSFFFRCKLWGVWCNIMLIYRAWKKGFHVHRTCSQCLKVRCTNEKHIGTATSPPPSPKASLNQTSSHHILDKNPPPKLHPPPPQLY